MQVIFFILELIYKCQTLMNFKRECLLFCLETINVVNDKHSIIDGTALTQKIEHNGDNVILSIRYPQLRVFTSNEKQGIKPITTFVIDEENLEGILIKVCDALTNSI